jgi:hypothetical protein
MTIMTQLDLFSQQPTQLAYGPFISRKEAKRQGLKRYYIGPCAYEHVGIRYVSTGHCCKCMSVRSKTDSEREKQRARSKAKARSEWFKEYYKARYRRNNPVPRVFHASKHSAHVAKNLRNRINLALNGISKSASTQELLGCSFDVFIQHLESQFKNGMSWGNRGRTGWHIDHIRPCASFDLSDPEQQRECFHYSNLQPLWAVDNIRKGSRRDWGQ